VFFIVVSVLLIRLRKQHIDHMSDLPLHDGNGESFNPYQL